MSRTHKDRPYWVIMNDRSLGTVEHHDHRDVLRLGHYKIVSRGEPQLVPYGEHRWFLRYAHGTPGMTVEEDMDVRDPYGVRHFDRSVVSHRGNLRWYYEQPQRYEYVGREVVEIDSDSRCDLGPHQPGGYLSQPTCTVEPLRKNTPYLTSFNRPRSKKESKNSERSRRRNTSREMHRMVGEYRSNMFDANFEIKETAPPHSPFGGGYWD